MRRLSLLKRPFALQPLHLARAQNRLVGDALCADFGLPDLRGLIRSRMALHFEVLALHHQPQVLQRSQPHRLALGKVDRCLWVWLSRVWASWRTALVIVQPEAVIAWHRRGFRLFWVWKSWRRVGRHTMSADVRVLIRTMSQANPLWGAPRIHGELLKLGENVSQATVAKYMVHPRRPPSQTWRTFLTNHLGQIAAADFFVVLTATCRLLFVLVILAHERRRVVHVAIRPSDRGMDVAVERSESRTRPGAAARCRPPAARRAVRPRL